MKNNLFKLIITLNILLLFPFLNLRAEEAKLITQLKIFDNDTTYRYLYIYENQKKVLETNYILNGESWIPKKQTEWIYEGNNCIIQREKVYTSNGWMATYEISSTYQNDRKLLEIHSTFNQSIKLEKTKYEFVYDELNQEFKREFVWKNNNWELIQTTTKKFDTNNLIEILITNFLSGEINKTYRFTYTYSADSTLTSQLYQEKTSESDWINIELTNWYYSPSKILHSQKTKHWNSTIGNWENSSMYDYTYENNRLVSEVYYYWKTMFWEKSLKYDYTYNEQGNLLKKSVSKSIYREWRNTLLINYLDFADDKANKMESTYGFWGGKTGDLVSSYISFVFNSEPEIKKAKQIIISYEQVENTQIPLEYSNNKNLIVYPNPSEDYFYFNIEEYKALSWSVYTTNGQLIKQQELTNRSGVIDLKNFPKGIYILKVKTMNATLTQKITKK